MGLAQVKKKGPHFTDCLLQECTDKRFLSSPRVCDTTARRNKWECSYRKRCVRVGGGCPIAGGHGLPGSASFEADGHGVEGEGAEEVAAHALFDLDEGAGGAVDPVDGEALGEAVEFGGEVEVADEGGGSGDDEEQIFNEAAEGAEEVDGFLLAVGAGAVGFGGVEELGIVGFRSEDEDLSGGPRVHGGRCGGG